MDGATVGISVVAVVAFTVGSCVAVSAGAMKVGDEILAVTGLRDGMIVWAFDHVWINAGASTR
jgi:hypothetical protein